MFALGSSFTCVRILQVLYLEFSRIVCVSLFSYQGSCLLDSSFTLPLLPDPVKNFFSVFSGYFCCFHSFPEVVMAPLCLSSRQLIYSIILSILCQQLFQFLQLFKLYVHKMFFDGPIRIPLFHQAVNCFLHLNYSNSKSFCPGI